MKVIIAGSRTAKHHHVIHAILNCPFKDKITEVVCGGAKGADSYGATWATKFHIPVKYFMPRWDLYGKQAGPIRNNDMAEYADALILAWNGVSPGSASMLRAAKINRLLIHEYIFDLEKVIEV